MKTEMPESSLLSHVEPSEENKETHRRRQEGFLFMEMGKLNKIWHFLSVAAVPVSTRKHH